LQLVPANRRRYTQLVNDATLAILAGGEGSRMGKPKGLLTINRVPILDFLLDRFAWTGPTMLITAPGREHPPGWQRFTRECVDPVARLGPLRGILTALEHAKTEIVVVATVDMPNVSSAQLDWIGGILFSGGETVGVMTQRNISGQGQIEPFPSGFRTTAIDILRTRLDKGARSVYTLKDQAGFTVVSAPANWPESVWVNLNNPEEFDTFVAQSI
jgi:molybdopterin-guanine dinucleotide biosynthesis protein A